MKIILSRHSAHKDNIPTTEWIETVKWNAKNILSHIEWKVKKEDILVLSSKENRAKKTAETIAEVFLENNGINIEEKEYLHFSPKENNKNKPFWKIIESFKILNQEYINYLKNWKLDDFVNNFHKNQIKWVNFNEVALYYIKKLKQTINIIKNRNQIPKLVIVGTHWWFIIESVLYWLFSDGFPKEWEWHIWTWETVELDIIKNKEEMTDIYFSYRWIKKHIKEDFLLDKYKELIEKSNDV